MFLKHFKVEIYTITMTSDAMQGDDFSFFYDFRFFRVNSTAQQHISSVWIHVQCNPVVQCVNCNCQLSTIVYWSTTFPIYYQALECTV